MLQLCHENASQCVVTCESDVCIVKNIFSILSVNVRKIYLWTHVHHIVNWYDYIILYTLFYANDKIIFFIKIIMSLCNNSIDERNDIYGCVWGEFVTLLDTVKTVLKLYPPRLSSVLHFCMVQWMRWILGWGYLGECGILGEGGMLHTRYFRGILFIYIKIVLST